MYYLLRNLFYKIFPFFYRYHVTRQFVKFCIVGTSNLAIDFSVYLFFTRVIGLYFIVANVGAFLVAVTWSFYWNKRWTFQHEEREFNQQYVKFVLTNIVGIILQTSLLFVLVRFFGWYDIWAKAFAVVAASVWNFSTTKFWALK